MHATAQLIDIFARGAGSGATAVVGLILWRGPVSRAARISGVLMCASIIAWLVSESVEIRALVGDSMPVLVIGAFPVAGLFWAFVNAVFEDRPQGPVAFAPPLALLAAGGAILLLQGTAGSAAWVVYNSLSGLIAAHAMFIVARGWNGDLVESRRRLRGAALGLSAAFALLSVIMGFAARIAPHGPWLLFTVGRLYGGLIFCALILSTAGVFLQVRTSVFGGARRPAAGGGTDVRAEAADRVLLGKLTDFMAGGGWRREGLTIGAVAQALDEPEHRLRRLINQRLGHRNFAEFVNSHRIGAAKVRLGDPAEARTTVAAIAFDLGYGSLGPFNRAFRAATGVTPTEWRRNALAGSPDLQDSR